MLGFAKGYSVSYLTGPVAGGREGYYSGAVAAGEPPGLWYGQGAHALGLAGVVDSDLMEAVYARLLDPRDEATHTRERWVDARTLGRPHKHYKTSDELYRAAVEREPDATPERRAELLAYAEREARQPVAFFDMTFSPSKSITVLSVAFERAANEARAAGKLEEAESWAAMNKAVEQAVMAGARASIDYLEEVAGYARVGKHGGGANRWGDANQFVVAQFLQHDSRDRDPQLHVHQAILNKIRRADGEWVGVDERALKLHRMSAAAVGERVVEAELAATFSARFEASADGKSREIVGVDRDVRDLFSSRRRAVTAKAAELIAEYEQRHGREASVHEQKYLREQATLLTRKAKSHDGETNEERLDRWEREARGAIAGGLEKVAHDFLAARDAGPADEWSPSQVVARALDAVGENQATWTRSDLIFAVSSALPANLDLPAGRIRPLLEGLADKALAEATVVVAAEDAAGLPSEFQLRNGLSAFQRPGSAKYATSGQMVDDRLLERAAVRTGAAQLTDAQVALVTRRFAAAGVELGVDQAAAVRGVATSGACVEVLDAAAGTGKSFTVGTLAEVWAQYGRRTIGLTASQTAADVMVDEGVTAFNFEKWRASVETSPTWQLRDGDLVVVDEAGMASTQDVADIARRCEAANAKLLLVGDPLQLAAVGPGGALADVGAAARRYELTEVRRFQQEWEREASLRLRDGDVSVLDDYDKHGRLRSCGTAEEAEADAGRAWLADTLAGKQSLLMVSSNEQAGRLSGAMRAELVRLGRVAEDGVALGRDGNLAGVGDLVQARRNNWGLEVPVVNRQTYRVLDALPDGGLRVETGKGVEVTLPASYVAEHLSLAYASTLHAAQGRTVDTGHDLTGSYVGMTRGREANTAWVTTQPLASDAPVGEAQDVEARTAKAVLADRLERVEAERGALAEQAQAGEDEVSTLRQVDRLLAGIAEVRAGSTSRALDRLAATGAITVEQREALAADQAMGSVDRLLRYVEVSGRNPEQVLHEALDGKSLTGATSVGRVLHARIRNTLNEKVPQISSYRDLIPAGVSERWQGWLEARADAADERRHELGARTAEEQPKWALETLGPVPEDPLRRAEWESRASWAAAHRENMEHTDEQDPLGAAPPAGLAEKHAVWATAHAALDLPDVGPEEAMLTTGQLLVRAAAWDREQTLAPRFVADELATTSETVAAKRTDSGLWKARADTLDGDEKVDLLGAAEKAEREADELEQRALDLDEADKARTRWYLHTAGTRDRGERSKAELGRRGVDLVNPADKTTAAEWLAAEAQDRVAGDEVRPIAEVDLVDENTDEPVAAVSPETNVPDLRDVAVADPTEHDPRVRREVPDADTTAEAVARARETLLEIEAREQADQLREDEEAGVRQQQWLAAPEQADELAMVRERS